MCPITSQGRGILSRSYCPGGNVAGVVLADQVRNMDWRARGAKLAGRVPEGVVREVRGEVGVLVG